MIGTSDQSCWLAEACKILLLLLLQVFVSVLAVCTLCMCLAFFATRQSLSLEQKTFAAVKGPFDSICLEYGST